MFIQNNNQNDATAKVGKNDVLAYENAQQAAKIRTAQQNILRETDIVNYSVSSAAYKTQLYILFSVIAVFEFAAALFFYISAFEVPFYFTLIVALAFAVAFHYFCHIALHDASTGIVFNVGTNSKAAKKDVTLSIIVAVLLLITAACTIFFVGKPSFETYRRNHYNTPPPPTTVQNTAFTSDQMTNKNGKINTAKVTAVAVLTENTAKANENAAKRYETTATTHKSDYDKTTAKTADIVGTSAFFIELLLAVFAYGIAAAKRAATIAIDVQAFHNANAAQVQNTGATQPETHKVLYQNGFNDFTQPQRIHEPQTKPYRQIGFQRYKDTNPENKPLDTPTPPETHNHSVTPENKPQTSENKPLDAPTPPETHNHSVQPETHTTKQCECANCNEPFTPKTTWQKYCTETCKIAKWEERTGKKWHLKGKN